MYSEPEWSQAISLCGTIEVLKEGKILETIPISTGTKCISVGRLPENEITLEHESISRKHAVVQFGPRNTAFIFDLDSTHGTFVNKKRIPSSQFVKITSGNAVVHFGASSRLFILHLEETSTEETIPDSKKLKSSRLSVTEFFSAHSIPFKSIIFSCSEDYITCACDFSEFISIDSSEPSHVTSSGTTKEEALSNFYEDTFNFLLRLGLIDASKADDTSDSDDDSTEDYFYTEDKFAPKAVKSSNEVLSEEQIIFLRDQYKTEIENIQLDIENFEMKIATLEAEIVDDLDVYVQDLKKTELKDDIEKCNAKQNFAKIELLKYENILRLIGSIEPSGSIQTSKPQINVRRVERKAEERALKDSAVSHKKIKAKPIELVLSTEENVEIDSETGIVDFEDSTIHDEQLDLTSLKRKYGY